MIEGQVNANLEAVVSLRLFAPITGNTAEVQAVVDTGFDDLLTLPFETVAALGLETIRTARIQLADGTITSTMLFRAEIEWHSVRRAVEIQSAPGPPLLGMALLEGSKLTISVRESGLVSIEEKQKAT